MSLLFSTLTYTIVTKKHSLLSYVKKHFEKQPYDSENNGLVFLLNKMQDQEGLIHSWVKYNKKSPDILLESMGQALEYVSLLGDQVLFSHYWESINKYFIAPEGYYFWQLDENTKQGKYLSTAFIDDLRLAKALFIFKNYSDKYNKDLKILADRIYKFNLGKNQMPVDFYDGKVKAAAAELSLFYIDVETLSNLANFDNKWEKPYEQAKNILIHMPENQIGIYPQKYKLDSSEYFWQNNVNMVENLYTAINAKNAGRSVEKFVAFLKKQIHYGHIFNHYSQSGKPKNMSESVSVYALAARLFFLEKDYKNAHWCYDKVQSLQITIVNTLHGGFGDIWSGKIYAFNQLEALLMYRYLNTPNS